MISVRELEAYSNIMHDYAAKYRQEYNKIMAEQRVREQELIQETHSFCPLKKTKNRTATAADVDRALTTRYGDGSVLRSIMCMTNSLALFPTTEEGDTRRSFRIRHYLKNLQQIGGESVEGYAMTADVDGGESTTMRTAAPFVVKAPRKISKKANLNSLHEYFVGAYGTNTLRDIVPNFTYTLGMFKCSPPYIDNASLLTGRQDEETKRIALTSCQNDDPKSQVTYVLSENITDSVTFRDFVINGASYEEYLNVIVQLVGAINLAATEIGFTHYDLHTENVLIKTLPSAIFIYYPGIGYVKTKHVATIIDFGRSHIKVNGESFGYNGVGIGIYPNETFPIFDIYKILCFSLLDAGFGKKRRPNSISDAALRPVNADVWNRGKSLLSFFSDVGEYAADYLLRVRDTFYTLPLTSSNNISPLVFYTDMIEPSHPVFIVSQRPPDEKLYGCAEKGVCQTLQSAIDEFTTPDTELLSDPYVFYEMMQSEYDVKQTLRTGRRYLPKYLHTLSNDTVRLQTEFLSVFKLYQSVPLKFNNVSIEEYRVFVAKTVRMFDLLTSMIDLERVTNFLIDVYDFNPPFYLQSIKEFRSVAPRLNGSLAQIERDAIRVAAADPRTIPPSGKWLREKLPTISAALEPFF